MCLPPVGDAAGPHFALLGKLAASLDLACLSMGMSADYPAAVSLGATISVSAQPYWSARLAICTILSGVMCDRIRPITARDTAIQPSVGWKSFFSRCRKMALPAGDTGGASLNPVPEICRKDHHRATTLRAIRQRAASRGDYIQPF